MPGGKGVPARSTEGANRSESSTTKMLETREQRGRGRPVGSKNKPKALIPKEMANAILDKMQPLMEKPDHDYLKSVIRDGKAIAIDKELDFLILLLTRQMGPALIAEMEGEQLPEGIEDSDASTIKMPEFRKDVTERLKVLLSMMDLKMKNERAKDSGTDNSNRPIAQIFLNRQLNGDRLRIAIEHQSGSVGGSVDGTDSGPADSIGEVSMAVSERPISLPGRGEGKADRVIDHDSVGDGARSVHEVEVSG